MNISVDKDKFLFFLYDAFIWSSAISVAASAILTALISLGQEIGILWPSLFAGYFSTALVLEAIFQTRTWREKLQERNCHPKRWILALWVIGVLGSVVEIVGSLFTNIDKLPPGIVLAGLFVGLEVERIRFPIRETSDL